LNLTAVLVTGLFAGGVSCAAVQGGLLTGLLARQRDATAPVAAPVHATVGAGRHRRTTPEPSRSRRRQLADDVTPVGGFLAGKLVSHTALGALLGALGAAVQLSIGARTTLQLLAGTAIVAFGLAQLGVPGFRRS
jgi:cytochrome c biogenesis protein CcdA